MPKKKTRRTNGKTQTLYVAGVGVACADLYDTGISAAASHIAGGGTLSQGFAFVQTKMSSINNLANMGIRRFLYGTVKKMVPSIPVFGKFRIGF